MNQKLIIGIATIVIVAAGFGIYSSNNSKTETVKNDAMRKEASAVDQEKDKAMMDDSHILGVLISKGKIMTVWEMNEIAMLDHTIMLKNGTKVSVDGKITDIAGKMIILKDGQELTTDGNVQTVDLSKMMMSKENDSTMKKDAGAMVKDDTAMMTKAGSYESYEASKIAMASATHDVVLYFRASWCPTCIALDKDIKANLKAIPESLTILDVNYDNSTELKKKYGVTYQHTFAQVDAQGNLIKKWSGSPTLASLVSEVK